MPPLNESDLTQFSGSENLFHHWTRSLTYTDGISHVAQHGGAYWLIDAIASYQPEARVRAEPFQLWELTVAEDRTATLTMRRDSGETPIVTQQIEFTTFPLASIKFYVVNRTLMLPSEY